MPRYQVDCEDANFLYLEHTESPTHIGLLYLYDQSDLGDQVVRFTRIRELIAQRIDMTPVFRRRICTTPAHVDFPYWEDDPRFDLDFHMRHIALPKPGDWRQLCIQVARLQSRSLNLKHPLWELYVIEGLDRVEGCPAGCFALYFKVHHTAMDEFTAVEFMHSLHLHTPDPRQHEQSAVQQVSHPRADVPSAPEMVLRGLVNNVVRSGRLALQMAGNWNTLGGTGLGMGLRLAQRTVDGDISRAHRFSRPLGTSRVFEGSFYPRASFEAMLGKVPGATLCHVALAVCGEAMRSYLERHGEPDCVPLNALLTINVRNAGAHALVGNDLALARIALHTETSYPIDRLQAIHATHPELYADHESELTSFHLRSLYEHMPSPLMAWLGRNAHRRASPTRQFLAAAHCGITEIEGGDDTLYLMGARMIAFTSIPSLFDGCGLMFSATIYGDRVGLTFLSDRDLLPDPQAMRACLDDAVAALADSSVETLPSA